MSTYYKAPNDGLTEAIKDLQQEKDGEEYAGIGVTMLLKWLKELQDSRTKAEWMSEFFFGGPE